MFCCQVAATETEQPCASTRIRHEAGHQRVQHDRSLRHLRKASRLHPRASATVRLDRGSEFLSKKFVTQMHQNGTKIVFTMAGAARAVYAERLNRNIKQVLRAVLATCTSQSGWCEVLPYVTASLNTTVNSATGFSAYRLVFGKNATTPLDRLVCVP